MSETENRADERRQSPRTAAPEERPHDVKREESEQLRSNPEVMGRTEPKDMRRTEHGETERPVRSDAEPRQEMPVKKGGPMERPSPANGEMDLWPEMREYKHRMTDIQSEFIEEPRAAVKKAEQLIEEAVDYMAKAMHESIQRMHKDIEGDADTEKLRLMMRNFSQFIEKLDIRRAA
jgi:hypothetical protein